MWLLVQVQVRVQVKCYGLHIGQGCAPVRHMVAKDASAIALAQASAVRNTAAYELGMQRRPPMDQGCTGRPLIILNKRLQVCELGLKASPALLGVAAGPHPVFYLVI